MTGKPQPLVPSKEGLERDLRKVLNVGVGRPTHGAIGDLELVAGRLSDPSLPPVRQVDEVVRDAIGQFGDGTFAVAMALVFGTHKDTADIRETEKRRGAAAKELGVSAHTMKIDREKRMHEALAHYLLKRYTEAAGDSQIEAEPSTPNVPPVAQDQNGPSDNPTSEPVSPAAHDGQDADERTITEHEEAGARSAVAEATDNTKSDEAPDRSPPRRPYRRLLTIAIPASLLLIGIAALLVTGGASSARHHSGTKNAHKGVEAAPFSPDRPTYDYDVYDPSNTDCADPSNPGRHFGRCGALTGHVLNSFVNTLHYGDERYFFGAHLSNQPSIVDRDPLTHVTVGSTIVLYIYVDNNTTVDLNDPGASDTQDTEVRVNLHSDVYEPGWNEWVLQPEAFISASNAQMVEDGVNLVGPEPFALQYEPGSAQLLRGNASYPLSDDIVGDQGALVGLLYMNGDLPAGNRFDAAGYVELRAKVVSAAPPEIRIVNQVRMTGSTSKPTHILYAKPGDDVEWLLYVRNGHWSQLNNIVVRDVRPPHLQLDTGSVIYTTAHSEAVQGDGPLFAGGYNFGNYEREEGAWVTFKTHILGDFIGCHETIRNIGHARSDQTPVEVTDDADVVITKPNCAR